MYVAHLEVHSSQAYITMQSYKKQKLLVYDKLVTIDMLKAVYIIRLIRLTIRLFISILVAGHFSNISHPCTKRTCSTK